MCYTQRTQEERYQSYILKKAGKTQTEIAGLLERDKGTISRELRRNHGLKGYRPKQAHQLVLVRRRAKTHPPPASVQKTGGVSRHPSARPRVRSRWPIGLNRSKRYPSVMSESTSISMRTSVQAVTSTAICAVRRRGAYAMEPTTGAASFPTRSRSRRARLSWPAAVALATGRETP